jgi:hypothetical protein
MSGYGQFGGGSFVIISKRPNGETLIREIAGSLQDLKNQSEDLAKTTGQNINEIVVGFHDIGSWSAKPSSKNKKMGYSNIPKKDKEEFHSYQKDFTGAGLAFPFAYGGLVKSDWEIIEDFDEMPEYKHGGKTPAWQRKEGKSPTGGLNAKGRASLKAEGHDIKPPQPQGGARKKSFCSRMKGMKKKNTSAKTANDPNSRINLSLKKWKC